MLSLSLSLSLLLAASSRKFSYFNYLVQPEETRERRDIPILMHMVFFHCYSSTFSFLCFLLTFLACLLINGSWSQLLASEEVRTLQTISSQLNNRYWKVDRNSCSAVGDFNRTFSDSIYSKVKCDCSFNSNNICHVTEILLKGLNLTGTLPAEFGNLSYLRVLDLTRNFINGTIPTRFSELPLTNLSLLGNQLSGSIPSEVGNIRTLEELVLEDNMLDGPLPQTLGNLRRLKRLLLSANNITGTIPSSFINLKNLTDFRIDGNQLSGKMPEWIGNLTQLGRLDMQGTSMEGPIPLSLSSLTSLNEVRISDLPGPSIKFPDLQGMKNLNTLILRNCLINDSIPDYIGEIAGLKTLDLSFNKLSGQIPENLQSLEALTFMFLNNNSLNGSVPNWLFSRKKNFDLSYNNFTGPTPASCQQTSVNLASSHSSQDSTSTSWCWKKGLPCSGKLNRHSLFINCGGRRTTFEGNEYDEDQIGGIGASDFFYSEEKWAYSSTGTFMGQDKADYIASTSNNSIAEIYQTARLSPTSLVYYGLCLRKGSYRVRLHFAEIMYSDDKTFSSNGRRVFDVSIQGNLVLKDFNIAEEVKGVNKGTYKDFDVEVNDGTLEIQFYWAGKGTTAIPDRGVYGPLISAIAVTPYFDVSTGLSPGVIAGIVLGSCAVIVMVLVALQRRGYLGKDSENKELRDLQTGYFSLRQIKAATDNFNAANKIGEGGFGPVYKGHLADGSVVAVKQLSAKSKQGNREFVNEIGMITALQHPNLVRLHGCCIEGNQLLLIYEYLENNSLARALFGTEQQRLTLDWATRKKICLGIARGLAYLHEESRLKVVHRDIKATNVLLDRDLNAKISDFGLAKLDEEENTHISTRVAGTIGYIAPEYAMRGHLTDKADVYSFGVVMLEVVSGKSNANYRPKDECIYLLDWAYVLQEQGNLLELVDPSLGSDFSKKEALRMLNLGILCANPSPTLRPNMSAAVQMLEGHVPVQAPLVRRSASSRDPRFRAFEMLAEESRSRVTSASSEARRSMSLDGPWIDSSISMTSKEETREQTSNAKLDDLYEVRLKD